GRGQRRPPALRVFTAVLASSIVAFGLYTAVKAAYLSPVFSTNVEERNLIYLSPLLFAGTAVWLQRGRSRVLPVVAAAGFVLFLVFYTPFQMDVRLYSDSPGFSILQMANRELAMTPFG